MSFKMSIYARSGRLGLLGEIGYLHCQRAIRKRTYRHRIKGITMKTHSKQRKGIAAAILLVILTSTTTTASANIFSAIGTWLYSSAACAALIAPPAQIVCALGAGILTGVAAVIPIP